MRRLGRTLRPALLLGAAILSALPLLTAAPAAGQDSSRSFGQADYAWDLQRLDGQPLRLEEYRGRTLFLNVWATWCAPCVAELASIQRLAESLAGEGVEFLIVSPEDAEHAAAFLRRRGYDIPAAVEDQRMPAAFGLRALPTTYVIDRTGRIVLAHRGAAEWDRPEVREFLRHLAR